jgi:hypothetical protein
MNYYVARNGQQYGPYTEEVVRSYLGAGSLSASDNIREESSPAWTTIGQLFQVPAAPPMMQPPASRSTMERWIALLVRYWAVNMTIAFQSAGYWPGFGYSKDEKAEMARLSQKCSLKQFVFWVFVVALIALPLIGVPMVPMIYLPAGPATAPIFLLLMGMAMVVCFTVAIPVAMLLSSALMGKIYTIPDSELPDRSTTARLFHKFWFQLTRIAIVMTAILVAAWIFIPDNSKVMVTLNLVMPFLAPAVSVSVAAYLLSARLRRDV